MGWEKPAVQMSLSLSTEFVFYCCRYNLQNENSDIDAFVVYQAHTRDLLSFNPPKGTVKVRPVVLAVVLTLVAVHYIISSLLS